MSQTLDRHIQIEALMNGVLNAIINGLIAWFMLKERGTVPLWGPHGFGVDLAATAFVLPSLVGMILIAMYRRKIAKGVLSHRPLNGEVVLERYIQRLPRGNVPAALSFGAISLLMIAPLTLAPFALFQITSLSPDAFAVFKGIWAGLLAAIIVRPIVLVALAKEDALAKA